MKCLSLNLWNINAPVEERMAMLAHYVHNEKPDIICFQEVSPYMGKIQISDPLTSVGYHFIYRESGVWKGREEGLAIATNLDIVESGFKLIPNSLSYNDMQRILLYSAIRYKNHTIHVYNTHLPYHIKSQKGREVHLDYVCNFIKQRIDGNPVILCGDFNTFTNEHLIEHYILGKLHLKDTWVTAEQYSFSSSNHYASPELWPDRRIDFVFTDDHFQMTAQLCMTELDGYGLCSDHYGVLACGEVV